MKKTSCFLLLQVSSLCHGWSAFHSPLEVRSTIESYQSVSTTQRRASLESSENTNVDETTTRSNSKSSSDKERSQSPWRNARWKITFDFGREKGSWMPDKWGKEGGRLVLSPLDVEIASDRPTGNEDSMLASNAWVLRPLSKTANYITMKGQQEAVFGDNGGWKIRMPGGTSAGSSSSTIAKRRGHASKMMCFVDLLSDIAKGDVKLSKGERIYMTGKCWREDDLENALKTMYPIRARFLEAQAKLEAQLQHETGDRRLDGTDPIQTIMGMKETAQLVLQRDEAFRTYEDARALYPSFDDDTKEYSVDDIPLEEGPWPGQVEWLSIEPGYLMVRRSNFLDEEYHVIGKWKAVPLFDGDSDGDDDDQPEPSIF
jgi:hypothetical protein